jgi:epoxyqueuosine reductase
MSGFESAIKSEAFRLGFHLVGITTPDPPPHFDVYKSWLKKGMHGSMGYLEVERTVQRRADPKVILPKCESIIVLGTLHNPTKASPKYAKGNLGSLVAKDAGNGLQGRVAAYAWGLDYHDVLVERMETLVQFIESRIGHEVANRFYTDTGPILERDFAQRAGLGWIGKNTCLINPQAGSYILLSEILLGVRLKPDEPFLQDRCGSCRRCIEACPTGCILPDRTIDSRRCLSYLTIELKGFIPIKLRRDIGNWVFGCDICQQVCPWNIKFAQPVQDSKFSPEMGVPEPDLLIELQHSADSFNRQFKGNPIKRAKRSGYLRNVAVAMGNSKSESAVGGLAQALFNDGEPLVRAHAAWALGNIGGRLARDALGDALVSETNPEVIIEIKKALET